MSNRPITSVVLREVFGVLCGKYDNQGLEEAFSRLLEFKISPV